MATDKQKEPFTKEIAPNRPRTQEDEEAIAKFYPPKEKAKKK